VSTSSGRSTQPLLEDVYSGGGGLDYATLVAILTLNILETRGQRYLQVGSMLSPRARHQAIRVDEWLDSVPLVEDDALQQSPGVSPTRSRRLLTADRKVRSTSSLDHRGSTRVHWKLEGAKV
jgi:hypothetical protein